MKITTVSYQKAFITGPFLQEKIGFEAEIEGGNQTAEGCLSLLKEMAERFHREANPHLYQESKPLDPDLFKYQGLQVNHPPPNPHVIDYKQKESLEISIDNASTLEDLAKLKQEAGANGLVSQYMNRLQELSSK
jgi:hypothetical protein